MSAICFNLDLSKILLPGNGFTLSQMTNFRLFQTESLQTTNFKFDENGRKFSKWVENTVRKGEIGCYEQKEKLLVTSNFSFSHSVFNRLV